MTYRITAFGDRIASTKTEFATTFRGFAEWADALAPAPSKAHCGLFSQTIFGDKRTDNGSLRSAENARECYGVELDYDGEVMTPKHAHETLKAAGIRHFIYTSASHRPEAPRWRVVVPFEGVHPVDARREAAEKCNGLLGGKLSSETFTLSQPFYIGRVAGVPYESFFHDGGASPLSMDLPRVPWKGARNADGSYRVTTEMLVDDLRAGVEVHPAIVALAARGFGEEELTEIVQECSPGWERPERGAVAIASDIPRACQSWARKKDREMAAMLAALPIPPKPMPVAGPPRRIFKVGEITAKPRPLRWLIRDHIEHPSFVMVYGPPEHGKTFVTVDWALSVALGREWNGSKVDRRKVLYITGEGHNGFGRRLMAWKLAHGVSDEEWNTADIVVVPAAVNMNNPEDVSALWAELTPYGVPDLVFIDTLTRMTPGTDQSSQKEMGMFVRACDDMRNNWGCTIVVVHHTGQADKSRAMGSIVMRGAVDVEVSVSMKKGGIVAIENTKQKEARKFETLHMQITETQLPWLENPDAGPNDVPRWQTSASLVKCDAPEGAKIEKTDNYAERLKEVYREGPFPEAEARRRFVSLIDNVKPDAARKAFDRALTRAVDAGIILYDETTGFHRMVLV